MSANALQRAVFERLTSETGVSALAGADRIFDGRPERIEPPYVTFGDWRIEDWSTGTEDGAEHRFEIEVWSEVRGRKQAAELADAVRKALHDAALTLPGFHLVNLRHLRTRTGRDTKSRHIRARLEFRAVLEPAAS
ncbi:MAG: hypothetical protein CML29_01810 [Rhizobiales bacterium]|nr:hypothetical protein [Hyphomicrobiales bacterium]MBA68017.1 hypothetical protein [Hyphomicrobiales bacterium]|tara:strand:- start:1409 stop:1816 length:408 start_codon:yes stop_codon:yes gene_type:complete